MTREEFQREILGVCKFCKKFFDTGKKHDRYQCFTMGCSIYDAHKCRRTHFIRKKMEVKNG